VPCAVYAEALISSRTQAAEEWMASGRYVKAERELTGLVELGSERPVAQKRPAELLPLLRKEIDRLQRTVEYPLPSTAAQRAKIARAEAWIQLEQLERAAEILEPLAPTDLNALLLLAVVNRDRQRWHESDANYHTALEQLLSQAQSDPSARERARLAFEGLAYNARQTHRRADAEQILRRAIAELPAEAARFHFLLGQHYASTGRPNQAIDHLTQAVELDPAKHRQTATELIRQLQSSTPSCLLR
jgi:tetratricopeptide (TPR) repeat protein